MPTANQRQRGRLSWGAWGSTLRPTALALMLASVLACSQRRDPEATLDRTMRIYEHGDMVAAGDDAEKGYNEFRRVNAIWAWRFTIVRARALYGRGLYERAIELLALEPEPLPPGDLAVQKLRIEGVAYASLHKFREADQRLSGAEQLCALSTYPTCGDVVRARGFLEMQRDRYLVAQGYFERALASAKTRDKFLEATALLNLSWAADEQTHFDEALDWADAARRISTSQGFAGIAQTALGNMGWAYYKLGDAEKAEGMLIESSKQAEDLGDVTSQARWLQALGYIYLDAGRFADAETAYQKSLGLARQLGAPEHIVNSLIALAFVSEQVDKLADARRYSGEAFSIARASGNGRDIVYPLLVQGRIATRKHDAGSAETLFRQVADSNDAPDFLKWEAQRSLAHLYEDGKHAGAADREYRAALSTFEAARSGLRSEHANLSFLSNATRIYDDYIHLLIWQGKIDEALQVADYDRGRTLREGLGLAKKGDVFAPEPLHAQDIARRAGGTILFYWLGEKQSYLWVITPRATRLFPLNASSAEIDAAVHSYRAKLEGPPEILEASSDGSTLYKTLIEPAHDFLVHTLKDQEVSAKNDRIFIIPDGSLNSLNFETLMPAPKHYWIEDVTLASAGSLRLLAAARPAPKQLAGKLLLMGDPIPPKGDDEYARLPFAAQEVKAVSGRFEGKRSDELTGDQATPGAYLNGNPEQFSYIHFVAHGEASRTSPLDSAIILSRDPASKAAGGEDTAFKLYARDIVQRSVQHRLQAELVTISACYGSGKRTYSGEGLVGLSWAFLRAGAHNVVGALWDVSSVSSAQLMDEFYGELQKGRSPSAALRAAKLSLLHSPSTDLRRPFYWAPFQLYTGS